MASAIQRHNSVTARSQTEEHTNRQPFRILCSVSEVISSVPVSNCARYTLLDITAVAMGDIIEYINKERPAQYTDKCREPLAYRVIRTASIVELLKTKFAAIIIPPAKLSVIFKKFHYTLVRKQQHQGLSYTIKSVAISACCHASKFIKKSTIFSLLK